MIFIDGLHLEYQVDQDIENALLSLNDNGIIIMHDCNPPTEWHQRERDIQGEWCGTVWKAFVKLRFTKMDISMFTIDTDYGCGVIKKGSQTLLRNMGFYDNYKVFNANRKTFLNLISCKEWRRKYL